MLPPFAKGDMPGAFDRAFELEPGRVRRVGDEIDHDNFSPGYLPDVDRTIASISLRSAMEE